MLAILLTIFLAFALGCNKKTDDTAAPAPAPGQKAAVKPEVPTDLSDPGKTVQAFFIAIDIILDREYQLANRTPNEEPEKARLYGEAMSRLRQMFVAVDHFQNVAAYLDLIQLQKVEIDENARIEGETAKVGVELIKGDDLKVDPMYFGENDKKKAHVAVELVKKGERWLIKDFGGLSATGS